MPPPPPTALLAPLRPSSRPRLRPSPSGLARRSSTSTRAFTHEWPEGRYASQAAASERAAAVARGARAYVGEQAVGGAAAPPQNRVPRYARTPEAMRAPVSLKRHLPANRFLCNEDPAVLGRVFVALLGTGGDRVLSDEVMWLAVTHKSFDQGRRGYNDRLSCIGACCSSLSISLISLSVCLSGDCFVGSGCLDQDSPRPGYGNWQHADGDLFAIGKRIVDLQTSLAILAQPSPSIRTPHPDPHGREPFAHPAMDILHKLTQAARSEHVDKRRLAALAQSFGLQDVVRWKPKDVGAIDVVLMSDADIPGSRHKISTVQGSTLFVSEQCTPLSGLWRCKEVARGLRGR